MLMNRFTDSVPQKAWEIWACLDLSAHWYCAQWLLWIFDVWCWPLEFLGVMCCIFNKLVSLSVRRLANIYVFFVPRRVGFRVLCIWLTLCYSICWCRFYGLKMGKSRMVMDWGWLGLPVHTGANTKCCSDFWFHQMVNIKFWIRDVLLDLFRFIL